METLSDESWDLVIAGTGLPQSLLALSLSHSNFKILHVDQNQYYGGSDAGLSLDEVEQWAQRHNGSGDVFSDAVITRIDNVDNNLKSTRSYTLSLRPQIIFASSAFLPLVVTSRIYAQLEFLAVGPWWTYAHGKLSKVPSTREDVFADNSLSRRDKVGLMKLLRHVLQDEPSAEEAGSDIPANASLQHVLDSKFKIPPTLLPPILALALAPQRASEAQFDSAVQQIRRHMQSMNHFGPGFTAVYPKYAGAAEIAQVACRTGAVGGSVYLLGHGIAKINPASNSNEQKVGVTLSNGVKVEAQHVVGGFEDLPVGSVPHSESEAAPSTKQLNMVAIVLGALKHFFPPTADNGPVPAVSIVQLDEQSTGLINPLYLQIHSEDTGECPAGQCCIYASTILQDKDDINNARSQIYTSISHLVQLQPTAAPKIEVENPQLIWAMSYLTRDYNTSYTQANSLIRDDTGRIIAFPPRANTVAFDDQMLTTVKAIWQEIARVVDTPEDSEFMVFPERRQLGDSDD